MKCEKCKAKEATVHFTQIQEGKVVSFNLCKGCAENEGFKDAKFDSKQQPAFAPDTKKEVLKDLVDDMRPDQADTCPSCGSTLEDIKQTGRMGCGKCYFHFENQVDVLMRRIQGSSFHVGSRPGQPEDNYYSDQLKIRELKKRLNESVRDEKYELAANIRDEIKDLEKKLGELSK